MAEMTVASTTDTMKDIVEAAGGTYKPESENNEEVKTASTTEEERVQAEEEKPEQAEPKAKSGFQKRIDKLTRDKYERDQQIQSLTARLEKLEKGSTSTEAPPPVAAAPAEVAPVGAAKPNPKDTNPDGSAKYSTYEEFVEALADWKSEQKIQSIVAKQEEEEKKQAETAARKAEFDAYNDRLSEARERYDDFDEVVGRPGVQIPEAVQMACIRMDNGPDVAYYLGQHSDVCKKLLAMDPVMAIAEVGAISAALRPVETQEPTSAVRRPSSAPAPIRPIGGSSTKSSVPIDELDYQEFKKLRNQQIKNRYR